MLVSLDQYNIRRLSIETPKAPKDYFFELESELSKKEWEHLMESRKKAIERILGINPTVSQMDFLVELKNLDNRLSIPVEVTNFLVQHLENKSYSNPFWRLSALALLKSSSLDVSRFLTDDAKAAMIKSAAHFNGRHGELQSSLKFSKLGIKFQPSDGDIDEDIAILENEGIQTRNKFSVDTWLCTARLAHVQDPERKVGIAPGNLVYITDYINNLYARGSDTEATELACSLNAVLEQTLDTGKQVDSDIDQIMPE